MTANYYVAADQIAEQDRSLYTRLRLLGHVPYQSEMMAKHLPAYPIFGCHRCHGMYVSGMTAGRCPRSR